MDTGKSPLRLASQGSAVHGQDLRAEGSYSTTENCDPNVMIGWTSTPVKNNNPLSAKSKAVVSSEKRVVQRELYSDGRVQETSRSPEKGSPTKVTVTPTRRHFCRSPRCAANDPDYASPVQSQPRKFLRSKRHLLPGWQAPPSSKRKVEALPAGGGHHPSTSSPGLNYEIPQVLNDACMVDKVNGKDGRVSDNCDDSITKDVQLEPTDAVADIYQSDSRAAERKNPENWMSDTLIREAVTRLAPEGEGGVHVLVQAFESIMLMEEETHDTKPARLFGRPGVGTSKALQNFVADHGQLSPAVLKCSIGKVQAWDETMVATPDLVDAKEEEEVQKMTTAGCSDDSGSCSTAEPMEQHNKGWGPVFSALDAVPRSDDDVSSDDGGSSTSSESGVTDGTFATQSQAEVRSNHRLKRYTSLQPFRLRTEERGALKEYEFAKRVEQLFREEQRLRVPVAQGLPWTTDEPDVPYKPPPKEQTRPVEFRLLSEIRAHERAEFDNYVAERRFQMQLERQEEERMRQLAEQEEIRRMRREMVPRAQLMPYFDRPFIPQRSSKRLTVPKEPCFHHIHSKKAKSCTMVSTA
ncbi:unnamed protein product [Sphagnum jensenii]|uniref:TPX2 C-terminal domain-containing protein n=1 Tax=Sphagnum jensenii TaxID=128206 RepID=A0ABP1C0W3_9BRYO